MDAAQTISRFRLEILPIEQLRPSPYNPRLPLSENQPAYQHLETSLREFGLVEPLIWNQRTGHVVGGHQRLQLLKKQGVREVPVTVVDLDDAREKALNIMLNNPDAQGRFDREKLLRLLQELHPLPEFRLTGFKQSRLRSLSLEPLKEIAESSIPQQVQIILEMDPDTYDRYRPQLDPLVNLPGITCHVKRR